MRWGLAVSGDGQVISERTTVGDPPRTLVEDQRLDQPTFRALYEAMPPGTRAELIDGGVLVQRVIGSDGLYRSTVFPGLWLDLQALVEGNRQRLRSLLDLRCATPEHAAFVARLDTARTTR